MKRLRNYVLWTMLSIMLQCSVVVFLDKVYFKQSSDFVLTEVKPEESKESATVSIPENAENIQVSYDGKYTTYKLNEKFYLVNVSSGECNEILTNDEDTEVLYSTWLPDRNGITVAEKRKNDSGQSVVNVINYDAKSSVTSDIKELCSYSSSMKIDDISINTLSAVIYISVSKKNKSSVIYRVDIEHEMDTVSSKIGTLGGMKVFPHKDILIYNDEASKKFYSYINGKLKKMNIGNEGNMKILSLDNNDNIYLGKLEDGKVKEILTGTLDTNISKWNKKSLDKARDINDIYINKNGEVIVNNKLEGKVINLATSISTEYSGKFLSVNNKVVSSIDNGELYIKKINH